MVKNNICLEGASNQNALFSEKCTPKNALMPSLSRIGPGIILVARHAQGNQSKKFSYLCNISRRIWGMKLIFCLQRDMKVSTSR